MKKVFYFFEREEMTGCPRTGLSSLLSRLFFVSLFVLITGAPAWSQTRTVTGTVLDENGAPFAGVSVFVEGTQRGVSTDTQGRYSMPNVNSEANLLFEFIGYQSQTVPVGSRNVVDISMAPDNTLLDEVVVVGYGTLRRSDVTGAVSRISDKEITSRPVTNAVQAMQGKLAGVDIASNNRPGTLGEVRVRGNRSIRASNDPLYVVDGIPLVSGTMAEINPSDIESIEVLKDASATAIYGSRAANGVILITSKKGQAGRTSINYDGSVTFSRINSLTDWMGAGELLDWERQGRINAETYNGKYGNAPDPEQDYSIMGSVNYMRPILGTAYQLSSLNPITPVLRPATAEEKAMGWGNADGMVPVYDAGKLHDEDWTKYVLRTGISQTHNLSLSAGTEKSTLYLSIGYLDDQSPMKDQDYERYTVNMNGSITPIKWLKVSNVLSGNYSVRNWGILEGPSNNSGAKDSYGQALALKPYAPAYDENGELLYGKALGGPSVLNIANNINHGQNEFRVYGVTNSFSTEVTLFPWLKYQYRLGAQVQHRRQGVYYDPQWVNPIGTALATETNMGYNNQYTRFNWEMENMLFAHKQWGKHVVDATLLQSASNYRNETINIRARTVTYPSSMWYSLNQNAENKAEGYGTGFSTNSLASYMARINYSFNDRYLLTASARWDGASVLSEGNKWDFFPSAAFAWKMEQEEFIKRVPWIQQLKLRLGYGVTGQQSVNPYQTTGSISSLNQFINDVVVSGNKANVFPNYGLSWEKTAQSNIGLDFALLNFRVNGSLEYYVANTSDLLMNRQIPITLGYTSVLSNIGKSRNQGVEITLSTVNVKAGDFTWTTDLNWTRNREKVLELSNGKVDEPGSNLYIGYPQGAIRASQVDRLWQDTPEDHKLMAIYKEMGGHVYYPGMVKLVDRQPMIEVNPGTEGSKTITVNGEQMAFMDNGFGSVDTDADKVIIGSRRPDWTAGMTNTFTYRNWSLSAFIHARVGGLYYGLMQTYGRRVEKDLWSPTNTGAKYPTNGNRSGGTNHSALLNYTSATIYSIKNISLSYTLPKSVLDKLRLSSGSVYVQALNPLIFGSELIRTGINPDDAINWGDNTRGGQTNNTMLVRSYVVGLRLGF